MELSDIAEEILKETNDLLGKIQDITNEADNNNEEFIDILTISKIFNIEESADFKKPTISLTTRNFNKCIMHNPMCTLMRHIYRQSLPRKLISKMYISRNIQIYNNRAQLSERPPQVPSYPKYERFRTAVPFYHKQIFWVYTSAVGGLGGIYYASHLETVPITNRRRFIDVTPKQEEKLAQQAYHEIMTQYGNKILPSWDNRTRFVRKVDQQIVRVSGMQDLKWEFYVIDSKEKNAFVLPGGKVFVFTGILPIVKNEDGLAAVLGHEIGHQVARHSAEKLSFLKIVILAQLFLSIFIDPGFLARLFMEFGLMLPFSRKCEIEADYIGLLLMSQACYDPREASKIWERMSVAQKGSPPQFLSTHPAHESRIRKIKEWMPEALQKRAASDCVHEYAGFMDTTQHFRKQWVRW
ncbi:5094_t:CDS:2 [Funneliformis caledonium]|uniref:5094_t:CDS:1 n=1 Tax=Funneliformis caledonium TaxID=1117310 RepID=A0A9N9GQ66_9GLOM|nr:5094_t:CDS:2 [Funneliformis caledonium]